MRLGFSSTASATLPRVGATFEAMEQFDEAAFAVMSVLESRQDGRELVLAIL